MAAEGHGQQALTITPTTRLILTTVPTARMVHMVSLSLTSRDVRVVGLIQVELTPQTGGAGRAPNMPRMDAYALLTLPPIS